jgi:hypothetical protein
MKKLRFILFSIVLLFPLSLSAAITRDQADAIVLEYIQDEVTGDYILLRNDNSPGEDDKTSVSWDNSSLHAESLSVEYPCWVYCLYNPTVTAPRTLLFLFVNKADGSLLAVKNRQASGKNPGNWTEIARTGATDEAIGYVVGYETCGLSLGKPGYIVITEDLKDTLAVYGLPEIFDFPAEAFPVTHSNDPGLINAAFPEKFRYAFKMQFTYTLSSEKEIHELGIHESCVIPAIYLIRSTFNNCVPVIVNSATKLKTPLPSEIPELTGIKWKLTGFVINGNAKAPEQDSNNSYWLLFKNDNTLEGKSSANFLGGTYEINYQTSSFQITNLGGTEIYEQPDGRFFIESLMTIRSFELQEDTLKLYYSETDYLRFSRAETKEISFAEYSFAGTSCQWANLKYDNTLIVINSKSEWGDYINCTAGDFPDIDFSKHSLLLACGQTTSGITAISKKISKSATGYVLELGIEQNDATVAQRWQIALVISKLSPESNIDLKVNTVSANNGQEVENPLTDLSWLKVKVEEIALIIQNGNPLSVSIYQCIYGDSETGFLIDEGNIKPFYNCSGEILCIMGGNAGETCLELNIVSKKLICEMNNKNSKI